MDITHELRRTCGHDSRDVDGCLTCESADLIESMRQQLAVAQEREQTNDILLEQQGDRLAVLNDQLADSQKQAVMLRDALRFYKSALTQLYFRKKKPCKIQMKRNFNSFVPLCMTRLAQSVTTKNKSGELLKNILRVSVAT